MKRGFNHFPAVIRAMRPAASLLVEKAVVDIAAQAGATAPIDTGALAASYYHEASGLEGMAGTNIEYGPYVEYGTVHTGAQPHLGPAADDVANSLGQHAGIIRRKIEGAARHG